MGVRDVGLCGRVGRGVLGFGLSVFREWVLVCDGE